MRVFAIDPGNTKSAYCVIDADTFRPLEFAKVDNEELRNIIRDRKFEEEDAGAIEMLQSYGNLIGKSVLETAVWVGRYYECLTRKGLSDLRYVYRMEVKMHICHDSRAKDSNISRALIDRFAQHDGNRGKGTKKNPDWFYGFAADIWAAYALGITYSDKLKKERE
jgi:hypothetical protein